MLIINSYTSSIIMDPAKILAERPVPPSHPPPVPPAGHDTFIFEPLPSDEQLGLTVRRRQSSPTSPGVVTTTSLVPPPPVSTPPVPALPTYLVHPPTLPKQHVYAPMAPLGALSIGLMKHKASEEDQFSRLINGKTKANLDSDDAIAFLK